MTLAFEVATAGVVGGLAALIKPERLPAVEPALAAVGTTTRMAA